MLTRVHFCILDVPVTKHLPTLTNAENIYKRTETLNVRGSSQLIAVSFNKFRYPFLTVCQRNTDSRFRQCY